MTDQELRKYLADNTNENTINLAEKEITENQAKIIAQYLLTNTKCKTLNLYDNNIGDSGAIAIAKVLEKNTSLTSIDLGFNLVEDKGFKAILRSLEKNTSLTSIFLSNFCKGDKDAQAIAKVLEKNISLTSISLSSCDIGDLGIKAIAKSLEINTSLTEIDLWGNEIGGEGVAAIAKALEKNTSLTEINLMENKCTNTDLLEENLARNEELLELKKDLVREVKRHEEFNNLIDQLKNNKITECNYLSFIEEETIILLEAIKKNNSLIKIDLGSTNISYERAIDIAEILEKNISLTSISLYDCNIEYKSLKTIAKALEKNISLTSINLSDNIIGDEGAVAIAKALETNTSLTSIKFMRNKIGDEGAKAIAKLLEKSTSLTSINLEDNNIGYDGTEAISKMLEKNTSLTEINLSDNKIRDAGTKLIANALEKNSYLEKISIWGNQIGNKGVAVIAKALENNTSLTAINLGGNKIDDTGAKAIAKALENNTSLNCINLFDNEIRSKGFAAIAKVLEQNISITAIILGNCKVDKLETQQLDLIYSYVDRNQKLDLKKEENSEEKFKIIEIQNHKKGGENMSKNNQDNNKVKIKEIDSETKIGKVLNLISEGNEKISGGEEEAILVMGRTGSGKSTLTNLLAGRKLKVVVDDDVGRFMIEAVEADNAIKISHNKSAETKIPNKCVGNDSVNNVVVWDCPGFNDTDVVQEIANGFYIQKLFSQHKKLKFILTVSESSITSDRGVSFVDIVKQFSKSFENVENILQSLSLVITGSAKHKQSKHLANELQKILNQNESLDDQSKNIIKHLQQKIVLFRAPEKEGILPKNDILKTIYRITKDTDTEKEKGDIALSKNAIEYCKQLIAESSSNIGSILNLLANGCKDSSLFNGYSEDNILKKNYELIKPYMPNNSLQELDNSKLKHNIDCYHLGLKQLQEQINLLEEIPNSEERFFAKVKELFETFAKYTDSNENHAEMVNLINQYQYFLFQQKSYVEMFSKLIKSEENIFTLDKRKSILSIYKNVLDESFEKQILNLSIDEKQKDTAYYMEMISYIELYVDPCKEFIKQSEEDYKIKEANMKVGDSIVPLVLVHEETLTYIDDCNEKLYKCYSRLGDLRVSNKEKLCNYLQALEYKKDEEDIYVKIADVYKEEKDYKISIQYFWAINNTLEIEECFDAWIEEEPRNHVIREYRGDVNVALGHFAKAVECYDRAKSINRNMNYREIIRKKIAICQDQDFRQQYMQDYKNKTEDVSFLKISDLRELDENSQNWHLDSITSNDLDEVYYSDDETDEDGFLEYMGDHS